MIPTMMRRARRAAIASTPLAFSALLLACADSGGGAGPLGPDLTVPGIHPVVVVASQTASAATLELHLKRVDVSDRIASVQGEISYDAASMRLSGASIPSGITGAWNEVRPGVVRFTGVAVEGIEGGAVLELRFAAAAPVREGAVSLRIEEMVAAEGFADLRPSLQLEGTRPALSRVRP